VPCGADHTTLAVLAEGGRHASIADRSVIEHGGRWIWVRPDGAETARLATLADDGRLSVEVAQTFDLNDVAEAFELSRGGHVRGKLIIVP
jgi:NADPH:quinone reductase-like Zn-dependent oxidoreductase